MLPDINTIIGFTSPTAVVCELLIVKNRHIIIPDTFVQSMLQNETSLETTIFVPRDATCVRVYKEGVGKRTTTL